MINNLNIVMYNNNKFDIFSNNDIITKKRNNQLVLLDISDNIFGKTYFPISYKVFKKFNNKIERMILTYSFINGVVVDDSDEKEYEIKYSHDIDSLNDLMRVINAICYSEYILNDLEWVNNSFYSYYFTKFYVQYKPKNKNKNIKMTLSDFYDKYKINENMDLMFSILMKTNKIKYGTLKDLEKYIKYKHEGILVPMKFNQNLKFISIEKFNKLTEITHFELSEYVYLHDMCDEYITDTDEIYNSNDKVIDCKYGVESLIKEMYLINIRNLIKKILYANDYNSEFFTLKNKYRLKFKGEKKYRKLKSVFDYID